MRFSFESTHILTILFCWSGSASAFVPSTLLPLRSPSRRLFMSSGGVTSEDILARARAAVEDKGGKVAGADGPAEVLPSEQFSPEILEDLKSSLQLFERRIAGGPGSLSYEEVEDLDVRTKRIVEDLLSYTGKDVVNVDTPIAVAPPAPVVSFAVPPPVASQPPPPPPPPPVYQAPPPPPVYQAPPPPPPPARPANMLHAVQPVALRPNPDQVDTSEDDGPKYDGTSGLGLAKGTANTYIIPGMDEMTGEEYREALQKSVSDRQARRRDAIGPSIGNKSSNNYLDAL